MVNKVKGRLALRVEGDLWVAYYALPDTMDGALFLGSIHMSIIHNEERKHVFMDLMRGAVTDIVESATGGKVEWPDPYGHPAPEHERKK